MMWTPANPVNALLRWVGRRSRREIRLLWLVWAVVLIYLLGTHLVLGSTNDLRRERIHLQASRVSLQKLEQLLERRDEIMTKAGGFVDDYLQAQSLEPSTLLLQRIDRARDPRTELISVYPLAAARDRQATRFRANLAGPPGSLGRLFFALGEGAPPIVLRELTLSAERRSREKVPGSSVGHRHP
jgi:hypothetical protein